MIRTAQLAHLLENLVERLEGYGAEAWISDLVEWIWYTTSEQFRNLRLRSRLYSLEGLRAAIRTRADRRGDRVAIGADGGGGFERRVPEAATMPPQRHIEL